jgi:hypothetical protein
MRKSKSDKAGDLRPEYHREDLGKGVRGKYYAAYQKGSNLVLLKPETAGDIEMNATEVKRLAALGEDSGRQRNRKRLPRPRREIKAHLNKDGMHL